MCPSNYNRFSDTTRYWSTIVIFHTPLHSTPPLGGVFPSEYHHPVWCGKTRMVWLPDGEKISKISLFILAQLTNVTDWQTDGWTDRHRMPTYRAYAYASRGKNHTTLELTWEVSYARSNWQINFEVNIANRGQTSRFLGQKNRGRISRPTSAIGATLTGTCLPAGVSPA